MNMFTQCMRWYGPEDPVSLADIRQAGATGVVTALHHIPNGAVWPEDEIKARKKMIADAGLRWQVVESVPVSEEIKTRTGKYNEHLQAYRQSIINLGRQRIHTVCYNFMPVLDWTRTNLQFELPNCAKALKFEWAELVAFDCFILCRPGASDQYTQEQLTAGEKWFEAATATEKEVLQKNIIAGLPGAEEGYSLEQFRQALDAYSNIDHQKLSENLAHFLSEVIPTAAEAGVNLAIHPDDPPFSIFGLPRVVSTMADLQRITEAVPSPANGITFCSGSLVARKDNDLLEILQQLGSRIHFVHLRNVSRLQNGDFYEDNHLDGDVPMVEVVKALHRIQQETKKSLPMRPDHGHQILDDLKKQTNPGYSAIGRLKGLAELRGVELGICGLD